MVRLGQAGQDRLRSVDSRQPSRSRKEPGGTVHSNLEKARLRIVAKWRAAGVLVAERLGAPGSQSIKAFFHSASG